MEKLYLGVDGGGTRCRARLVDASGSVLGEAVTGLANITIEGGDTAFEQISLAKQEVFRQAGLSQKYFDWTIAGFGLAGAHMESARLEFVQRDFGFAKTTVQTDVHTAAYGAHDGRDGALLIVGTGSAGISIAGGEISLVGGWGFYVSDVAAGASLGRAMLRRSLQAHEGLSDTSPMTQAIMDTFENSQETVMKWGFSALPKDYANFVPQLFDYYSDEDPVAVELMNWQLTEIDRFVRWFKQKGAPCVAFVGGLGVRLMPVLIDRYGDYVVETQHDALEGAIIMARSSERA